MIAISAVTHVLTLGQAGRTTTCFAKIMIFRCQEYSYHCILPDFDLFVHDMRWVLKAESAEWAVIFSLGFLRVSQLAGLARREARLSGSS